MEWGGLEWSWELGVGKDGMELETRGGGGRGEAVRKCGNLPLKNCQIVVIFHVCCLYAQVSEVEGLRGRLSKLSTEQVRELAKREAEREIIFEDLEALNDQYQQLNMAFEMQSGKLTEAKVCKCVGCAGLSDRCRSPLSCYV